MAKSKTDKPGAQASAPGDLQVPPKATAAQNEIATTGDTVTVICKMPHGLRLRIFDMVDFDEPILGGGFRSSKVAEQIGPEIVLNGSAKYFGQDVEHRIVGGYGLTDGVSKDFFEKWLSQNKDLPLVREKLVMAFDDNASAVDGAKDHKSIRTGIEPLMMLGDPRAPKRVKKAEDAKEAA